MLNALNRICGFQDLQPLVKPSSTLIQAQAALIKTTKIAQEWINKNSCIQSVPGCTHPVLCIYSTENLTQPKAYFKLGRDQGIMEKIVWEVAGLLGWDDLFTATKLEMYYLEMVEEEIHGSSRTRILNRLQRGSLQKAIPGTLLNQWKESMPLNRVSLCRAFTAMFILGLSDLHPKNIMVLDDGSIKLFDNGKCLPPGNQFIIAGENLFPVHRFSPLNLPEGKCPLDAIQVEAMQQMVDACRNRWQALEAFFSTATMKSRCFKLPMDWLDPAASLQAMKERIEIFDCALKAAEGCSLEDLMVQVYPEYKFSFLLSMIYAIDRGHPKPQTVEDALRFYHQAVGAISLFDAISHLFGKNYDLLAIDQLAHDPDISLRQIVAYGLLQHPKFTLRELDKSEALLEKERIQDWLLKTFKDMPRDHKNSLKKYPEYRPLKDLLPVLARDFLLYRAVQSKNLIT